MIEGNETTTYFYDEVGNLKETQFPNDTVEKRSYDELNRLKVLEVKDENDEVLAKYEYELNDAGYREQVKETLLQPDGTIVERTIDYDYDELYRLLEAAILGGETVSYAYDDVGNRISSTDAEGMREYIYDDNDRLMQELINEVVVVSYSYDDNGNLKTRTEGGETVHYVWDDQNRLVEVQSSSGIVNYAYDDDNIRVSQTVGTETTSYLLDKNRPYAQVLAEYVGDEEIASYVYGLDLISQERNNVDSYYLVDGLGSTRGLTDENGNVTDVYHYDAYGNLIDSVGNSENSYLFAGEQLDSNLDQYYLRDRYYDSSVGRFTRRDTYEGDINNPMTLHKYIYANSNPVNGIDPSGLFTLTEVSAARQIRNNLAEAQFTSYTELIRNTDSDGLGGKIAGLIDLAQVGFTIGNLLLTVPISKIIGNIRIKRWTVLYSKGKPVPPIQKTLEQALNPEKYLEDIVKKYGINLRGSGQKVKIKYDPGLGNGIYGVTKQKDGGKIIYIGRDALQDEAVAANTIAHELSHARDYLKGGLHKPHGNASSVADGTVYGSGNALQEYIEGKR